MALPLAYLAVRSLGAPSEAWELFFRLRTAQILWRTVLLVLVVTGGTLFIGVPLAWLTARTDMPMRCLLSVLVALAACHSDLRWRLPRDLGSRTARPRARAARAIRSFTAP